MEDKYKQSFMIIFLAASLSLGRGEPVYGEEGIIEIKKEYRTTIKEEDGKSRFKDIYEKDGVIYRLKSVQTDHVEEIAPGDRITYDSVPFAGSSGEYEPEETIERNGKIYRLKTSSLTQTITEETVKYAEASIQYKGVEYIDFLPEDAEVKVINDDLKQELKVRLPAVDYKEEGSYWDYNFTFPITVTGYDADSYMLGQREIPSHSPLIDHSSQFLEYLNLPPEYYSITRIEWNGEPVCRDGETVRKATAYGRKLVKDMRGTYGGDVTFPSADVNVCHGVYVEEDTENPTDRPIYLKHATAVYQRQGRTGLQNFLKWLLINMVTIALFTIFLIVFLLFVILKKRAKRKENADDFDQSDE